MTTVSLSASSRLRAILTEAVDTLQAAGINSEQLASLVPSRKRWFFTQKARFEPTGKIWPLGVLLLGTDAELYSIGETTRAVAPGYPGHVSLDRERRRELTSIAHRGPFPEGTVIHFNAHHIDIQPGSELDATSPVILDNDVALVRWNPGISSADARPFEEYIQERVQLLIEHK